MKRLALSVVVLILALSGAVAQEAAPLLSLSQAIDAALANGDDNRILGGNLDIARAQHALNVSKNSLSLAGSAGYGQGWTFGDPSLQQSVRGVSGTTGPTAGLTLSGPLTSVAVSSSPYSAGATPQAPAASSVAVAVSQTLWNGYWGGGTQAAVDKSLLALQGKEIATESGRLALVYRVKQAYYTMLSAQRNDALKREILAKQNAVLKQIQAVYDLKQASLVDLKSAQINARSAQVDADSAGHDLRMAHMALATLMGQPPDSLFTVADAQDPAIPVSTIDEAIAEGLKRRVEPKQLELNVKSGTIDAAVARGLSTPTVSVSGGLSLEVQWAHAPTDAWVVNAGVKVAMPILDAGTAQNQVDAASRQNAVYAIQEEQTRKGIASDIRNAWEGVQLAREKLELSRMQADASALQDEILKTEFDKGTASNQDVLTAAVNDANALTAQGAAASALQLALLQLLNVMGY